MRQRFVYYRVLEDQLAPAVAAARAMQQRLAAEHPGLEAAMLRRPEAGDGQVTLMETYRSPWGIGPVLGDAIEADAAALSGWIDGTRHVEEFEPL